jgi:hypothetical protein
MYGPRFVSYKRGEKLGLDHIRALLEANQVRATVYERHRFPVPNSRIDIARLAAVDEADETKSQPRRSNDYLHFHRPCEQAEVKTDAKGKPCLVYAQ